MVGISTSEETLVDGIPGPHPADDPLLRARSRSRSGGHGRRAGGRVPRERAGGGVDPAGRRRRRRRQRHLQPPDPGLPGPRAPRGRRGARRHQRARRRRATPADRRHARDRLPDAHGAGRLPARVVVHRADLDPRRNRARPAARLEHHPRPARAAELGEPRARRALAEPRPSSSWSSTPSRIAATLAPAIRASRISPAEALRYQ